MSKRVKNIIKRILILCVILAVIGFLLNWFLADKLERYLREKLSEIVLDETDGFYRLEYDELNIGLFNGELSMKGIRFNPDPLVFEQWKQKDSLPPVYTDFTVGSIEFKGINLVWRLSYSNLDFSLFEINKPVVNVYDSENSGRVEEKSDNVNNETLYDLISPFIDVLTVQQMNLNDASITYIARGNSRPSVYSLTDVNFHAYGFRLDENSYYSGNLLYCDDFDFTADKPQYLLTNDQMILNTSNITLSTQDSIIKIQGINLIPQKMLWAQMNLTPEGYIEAEAQSLEVKGIVFSREDALNYLDARSFNVNNSDFKYFNVDKKQREYSEGRDSVNLSWTLYTVISPILQSVSIDQISVNDATFAYSSISDDASDVYQLDKLNFNAYDFKVDPLSDQERKFLYSESFDVEAQGIGATIESRNHVFAISDMTFDAREGWFSIKNIQVWPWSTKTESDYMKGSVDSITIGGLEYDKGLKAKAFAVNTPVLEYVKMPEKQKKESKKEQIGKDTIPGSSEEVSTIDLIMPFFDFFMVDTINLKNGNITFRDKRDKQEMVYKLPKIDFYVTGALVNEHTINHSDLYFTYKDLKFSFKGFDNLLPDKEYRLRIKEGAYTGLDGDFKLKDVHLIPQLHNGDNNLSEYLDLTILEIDIKRINYQLDTSEKMFRMGSVEIVSPKLDIIKIKSKEIPKTSSSSSSSSSSSKFNLLLDSLMIDDIGVRYADLEKRDSAIFTMDLFKVKVFKWDSEDKISIQDIIVNSPLVKIENNDWNNNRSSGADTQETDFPVENLDIGNIRFNHVDLSLNEPGSSLQVSTSLFDLENLKWSKSLFGIKNIFVEKPVIKINTTVSSQNIKSSDDEDQNESAYQTLAGISKKINIGTFNFSDAEIDYSTTLNGKTFREQQVNSTHLDFTELILDTEKKSFSIEDFNFKTRNLRFPIDNGFYTLRIGEVDLHKRDSMIRMDDIHLIPAYPKEEFAYYHPSHADWFDVSAKTVSLSGIDYATYFSDKILNVRYAEIEDPKLLNYKNQQIEIEHNIMPMLYEGIQKAPVPFDVNLLMVKNMYVLYEELPEGKDVPGKILFTEMNGKFTGFTNVVKGINHYIRLDADGKFMGKGDFTAVWMLPVDSLNDNFLLSAHLRKFDLKDLNPIFEPLASAKVNNGLIDSMLVKTEASSKGATVQMRLIYKGLNVAVLKDKDGETEQNKFISGLANLVIKTDNPDRRKKTPRESYVTIVRDPYHSTFNYLWQILQPPLVESVGVSQRTQNFFKGMAEIFSMIKDFFTGGGGDDKKSEEDEK